VNGGVSSSVFYLSNIESPTPFVPSTTAACHHLRYHTTLIQGVPFSLFYLNNMEDGYDTAANGGKECGWMSLGGEGTLYLLIGK